MRLILSTKTGGLMPDATRPGSVVEDLIKIANVVGKYGVSVVIFAFPPLVGCFGLYFMWITMNESQVNMAKVTVGIFAVVFGSALSILLLYVFNRMNLWDKLGLSKLSQEQQASLESRVKALEEGKIRGAVA